MLGASAICELAEAKPLIERLKTGDEEACAVLERLTFIDYYTLCDILLPDHDHLPSST
jgi:hypothetical protein